VKIRKGTAKDAKICAKIRAAEEDGFSAIDFAGSVKDKHCIFLVAEKNRKVIGYCIGYVCPDQRKEAMLHETRIIKDERKAGTGTALVKAFCKEAFGRRVKHIYAFVEKKHVKFYGNSGFRKSNKWIELKKTNL
jgi:N-acetylglutamate synthase-like GNAT family acetyltransferase